MTAEYFAYEEMLPSDLDRILRDSPIAYVPVGTYEFHGWHLPLGFDALKAAAICTKVAQRTGGAILPPLYYGFGGGHKTYTGSIIADEATVYALFRQTLDRLIVMGFKVIVLLTGHYPDEQLTCVKLAATDAMKQNPHVTVIGLAEYEAFPDEKRMDHAAKWETSIALYLMPELVDLECTKLYDDPLYGVCGEDPRKTASESLGRETVSIIIGSIEKMVREALY